MDDIITRRTALSSLAAGGAAIYGASALPLLARTPVRPASSSALGRPEDWDIGPIIKRRNYSVGMPLHPAAVNPAVPDEGWYFDFPGPSRANGHVHYVTRQRGPLSGAKGLRVHYRIDAARGTRFIQQEKPDGPPATMSLFIQRARDNWLAKGRTFFHRWYSPANRVAPLRPGENALTILFSENWINVLATDRNRNPREFATALADSGRMGLTFGGSSGRGHGVFATKPARFTLLAFDVI